MIAPMTCESCTFAVHEHVKDDTYVLICHRNPPQTNIVGAKAVFGWPKVHKGDWCGEWRGTVRGRS